MTLYTLWTLWVSSFLIDITVPINIAIYILYIDVYRVSYYFVNIVIVWYRLSKKYMYNKFHLGHTIMLIDK